MLSTNDYKLAALNLMRPFRVLADSQAPPVGAAAARRAEKKAQKKANKDRISLKASEERIRLAKIQEDEKYFASLRLAREKALEKALMEERNKHLQALVPSRLDFKQCWQGWKITSMSAGERIAIMTAKSYYDLNTILQEQARIECEKANDPFYSDRANPFYSGKTNPFYIGITNLLPGVYTPARNHNDWHLEGQRRASRIASVYDEYIKVMDQKAKSIDKVSDPILVKIVKILNSVGKDAWPFTLALSPVHQIRTTYFQEDPIFKQIAQAFGDEISLYLDNLENIQKVYNREY
jgi:hypothetical protein